MEDYLYFLMSFSIEYPYQCCNEDSKIFEASKIFVLRFIFGPFSEAEERSFEDFRPKIAKILWENLTIFWTKLSEKFKKYVLFFKL